MDKQKRELAWLIFQEADCSLSGEDCSIIADLLIKKGYRKHSTADVAEVGRGEWIFLCAVSTMQYEAYEYRCSLCNEVEEMYKKKPFCPNCGADMRGERKE